MAQQSRLSRKMMMAAAGNAEPLYVDDVFSTYVYDGNGTSQSITNNIDLSTEGGMVWIKNRDQADAHIITDTERGAGEILSSNATTAETTDADTTTAFNTDGFIIGADVKVNTSTEDYVSWTFRKAPKFFDVVTYTGNGTSQTINHNLGSIPGCIIVKCTSNSPTNWGVYHRGINVDGDGLPETDAILLDGIGAAADVNVYWNDTAPTATQFTVGSNITVNNSGYTYVAYLFAHNNSDGGFGTNGDEDIIKCGSYTGTGSAGIDVSLGFEPQFVIIKNADTAANWVMLDNIRGIASELNDNLLIPNSTNAESTTADFLSLRADGFTVNNVSTLVNGNTDNHIYIAIRRPHKPAESGSEVFAVDTQSSSTPNFTSGFPVDVGMRFRLSTSTNAREFSTRLTQGTELRTNVTDAEISKSGKTFDYMDGWRESGATSTDFPSYMFKRSPGFMDVVCYEGTGVARTVDHNLTVAPEMMIVKRRTTTNAWAVYHHGLDVDGDGFPETDYLTLNQASSGLDNIQYWNDTAPTASNFTVGVNSAVNQNLNDYIAILFATQDGISKVGSYTGNGTSQTIDCGFTTGARFVLIKRTDSTGDWFVWDSLRGIVAGNDPFIILNDTDAQNTLSSGTGAAGDHLDPDNSGFIVNETTGVAINTSSAEYIYLAIS